MSGFMKLRRASSKSQTPSDPSLQSHDASSSTTTDPTSPRSSKYRGSFSSDAIRSPVSSATSPISPDAQYFSIREEPPNYFEAATDEKRPAAAKHSGSPLNQRLQEMSVELGVDLVSNLERIAIRDGPVKYATKADETTALDLLNERRQNDPEYKSPSGFAKLTKSKAKLAEFSYKEVNRALSASAVSSNNPLGVVDSLISMGGSVDVARKASTNKWKKMTKTDQADHRSDVLQNATRVATPDMIRLLAGHADQTTLSESLRIAVPLQDLDKVKALLEFDADACLSESEFLAAVAESRIEVVRLLLSARKGLSPGCVQQGLVEAVRRSSLPMIKDLLQAGANTEFDDARALKEAVEGADIAAVLAITASAMPPTADQLDAISRLAYLNHHVEDTLRLRMLEMCLCAGARGPHTQTIMQDAAAQKSLDSVNLLLRYDVSLDKDEGKALCTAVEQESEAIVNAMLNASPGYVTLGNALKYSCTARKLGLQFAVDLMQKGASVDFEDGAPLVTAISTLRNDILQKVIEQKPAKISLEAACNAAVQLTGEKRLAAFAIILPARPPQDALDAGLVHVVREPTLDHPAIDALLQANASPDGRRGEAVIVVACRCDIDALEALTKSVRSPDITYSRAVAAVVAQTSWNTPEGLGTLQWLLEKDADPVELEPGLFEAAASFDIDALQFLADWITGAEVYTVALTYLLDDDGNWLQGSNLEALRLLLEKGASGTMVDVALGLAVKSFLRSQAPESFVDILLEHGADINADRGQVVQLAIETGNPKLLSKLYGFGPSAGTLSSGISWALINSHHPDLVIELIDVLVKGSAGKGDLNCAHEDLPPPIFLALQYYGSAEKLIRHMCQLGCKADTMIEFNLFGDFDEVEFVQEMNAGTMQLYEGGHGQQIRKVRSDGREGLHESMIPPENVTALAWGCCQVEENAVSASVIEVLIRFRGACQRLLSVRRMTDFATADVNFTTTHSRSSPLLLAARYQRPDIVSLLVKQKPDGSAKDNFQRTALCYAAANGDRESVKSILTLSPRINDGSLHEAARELQSEVMSQLLRAKHDANFPSPNHDSLTPLGVLCMYCDGTGYVGRIEDCIDLLVKYKVDALRKWNGKTVLYLAMDNPVAVPVTTALVSRTFHQHINSDRNEYYEDPIHYSPTMYLEKGNFAGSEHDRQDLLRLLRGQGAEDKFYVDAKENYQPEDAVGMPANLKRLEDRRQEHQLKQEQEAEAHYAKLQRQQEEQMQYLEHQDERQEQRLAHIRERGELDRYEATMKAVNDYRIQENKNRQIIHQRVTMAQIKAQENHAQLQHKQQVVKLNNVALRNKIAANHQIKSRNELSAGRVATIKTRGASQQMMINKQKQSDNVRAAYAKRAIKRY